MKKDVYDNLCDVSCYMLKQPININKIISIEKVVRTLENLNTLYILKMPT